MSETIRVDPNTFMTRCSHNGDGVLEWNIHKERRTGTDHVIADWVTLNVFCKLCEHRGFGDVTEGNQTFGHDAVVDSLEKRCPSNPAVRGLLGGRIEEHEEAAKNA